MPIPQFINRLTRFCTARLGQLQVDSHVLKHLTE
jgi:hypothetical protein